MLERDEKGSLRFLDIRLGDWPLFLTICSLLIGMMVAVPFAGFGLWGGLFFLFFSEIVAYFGIRLFYNLTKNLGRDPDWDRLPEVLNGMVKAKVFTEREAMNIFCLFFPEEVLRERSVLPVQTRPKPQRKRRRRKK